MICAWSSLAILLSAFLAGDRAGADPITRPLISDAQANQLLARWGDDGIGAWSWKEDDDKVDDIQQRSMGRYKSSPIDASEADLLEAVVNDSVNGKCPLHIEVLWTSELASSVLGTPAIFTSPLTGTKHIAIATMAHTVELLDAAGGTALYGWPVSFEGLHFHASPTLFDVNRDGIQDICLASTDGRLLWLEPREFGKFLPDEQLKVPTLQVNQEWFVDIDLKDPAAAQASFPYTSVSFFEALRGMPTQQEGLIEDPGDHLLPNWGLGRQLTAVEVEDREGQEGQEGQDVEHQVIPHEDEGGEEQPGGLPADELDYYNLLYDYEDYGIYGSDYGGLWDLYSNPKDTEGFVGLDGHILAPPVFADVDGDGFEEAIIGVSYFFDRSRYGRQAGEKKTPLGQDIAPAKYVASALLCYDFVLKAWLWASHLELTTDDTALRAYVYSSPVVVDLDGDDKREVIIGTAAGLLYILDAHGGYLQPGFPVQFGPLEAAPAVADVVGDEHLELIVGDTYGTLAVLSDTGDEIWSRRLTGGITSTPMIGDVDGDGMLDIVVGVTSSEGEGHLWAVRGRDGGDLPTFPIKLSTGGGLSAPPLLVDLHPESTAASRTLGLHIVVPSLDGHLYIVEGRTGCTNKLGLEGHVYSQVLASDLDSSGMLSLVLATMDGRALALSTGVPAHPLNAWEQERRGGRNGFVHGMHQGIYALSQEVWVHPVEQTITLEFEILDCQDKTGDFHEDGKRTYQVAVSSSAQTEPFGGKNALFRKEYTQPGRYTEVVSLKKLATTAAPRIRTWKDTAVLAKPSILSVSMEMGNGLHFTDCFQVRYHAGLHHVVKWMLVLPTICAAAPLLLVRKVRRPLPS